MNSDLLTEHLNLLLLIYHCHHLQNKYSLIFVVVVVVVLRVVISV